MPRALRWTAAAMAAATLVTSITGIVVSAVAASQGADYDVPPAGLAAFLVAVLAPASVGLFVALRRPGNRVAWILVAGPLSVALVMTAEAVAALTLHRNPDSTLGAWATLVAFEWQPGRLISPACRPSPRSQR